MQKFVVIQQSPAPDVYFSANPVNVSLDTSTASAPNHTIILTYDEGMQLRLQAVFPANDFTQDHVDVINAAIAQCWKQGFTDSTIDITDDIPLTGIALTQIV